MAEIKKETFPAAPRGLSAAIGSFEAYHSTWWVFASPRATTGTPVSVGVVRSPHPKKRRINRFKVKWSRSLNRFCWTKDFHTMEDQFLRVSILASEVCRRELGFYSLFGQLIKKK